ncbi:MAG: hypothetical protein R3246_14625, partial [Acidimicrobiia bacterium]|nr:hypothetical protein [Acidimicrobiia bacterium]
LATAGVPGPQPAPAGPPTAEGTNIPLLGDSDIEIDPTTLDLAEADPTGINAAPSPDDPMVRQFFNWQRIAKSSANVVHRAIATEVTNRIADRIAERDQNNYLNQLLDERGISVQALIGADGPMADEEAEEVLNTQMDRMSRLGGLMPQTMWAKLFDDEGDIDVDYLNERLNELRGVSGIVAAFSMGIQAGRFLTGEDRPRGIDTVIDTAAKRGGDPRTGAFYAGVLAGHTDITGARTPGRTPQ